MDKKSEKYDRDQVAYSMIYDMDKEPTKRYYGSYEEAKSYCEQYTTSHPVYAPYTPQVEDMWLKEVQGELGVGVDYDA